MNVFFRGDSRPPEEIFENGMEPLAEDGIIRLRKFNTKQAGDIDPKTAVCVSTNIKSAAMFPIDDKQHGKERWIYIIFSVVGKNISFDTNAWQKKEVKAIVEETHNRKLDVKLDEIAWPLYGYEEALFEVASCFIYAAVKCTIKSRVAETLQVKFTLGKMCENKNCMVNVEYKQEALKNIEGQLGKNWIEKTFDSTPPNWGLGGVTV